MDKKEINKLKYETPVLVNLGEMVQGVGIDCAPGSGADVDCTAGGLAVNACTAGTNAQAACTAGGNV